MLRRAMFLLSGGEFMSLVVGMQVTLDVNNEFCEFFVPAANASRHDVVKQRELVATTTLRMELIPPSTREESNMVRSSVHFLCELRDSPKIQHSTSHGNARFVWGSPTSFGKLQAFLFPFARTRLPFAFVAPRSHRVLASGGWMRVFPVEQWVGKTTPQGQSVYIVLH